MLNRTLGEDAMKENTLSNPGNKTLIYEWDKYTGCLKQKVNLIKCVGVRKLLYKQASVLILQETFF